MKMLLASLMLAAVVNTNPPNLDNPQGVGFARCPDESVLMIENFDEGHAFFRQGVEKPFAYVDRKNKEVYVFSMGKWFDLDTARSQWESPCDIPGGTGV